MAVEQILSQIAAQITVDYGGMDVILAADGGGVAKLLGNHLHHRIDVLSGLAFVLTGIKAAQFEQRERRAAPGTKILRREISAADLAQIGIYIRRGYGVIIALFITILEKLLPRHFLRPLDDLRQPP